MQRIQQRRNPNPPAQPPPSSFQLPSFHSPPSSSSLGKQRGELISSNTTTRSAMEEGDVVLVNGAIAREGFAFSQGGLREPGVGGARGRVVGTRMGSRRGRATHRSQASTDALRASVLDAALQLGYTANPTVSKWLFEQPADVIQEEGDMNAVSPSLASASTTDESSAANSPHTPYTPYSPPTGHPSIAQLQANSPATVFHNPYQPFRHKARQVPSSEDYSASVTASYDGHTESTHSQSHAPSGSSVSNKDGLATDQTPEKTTSKSPAFAFLSKPPKEKEVKKLKKKKKDSKGGGYETDGGYTSEAAGGGEGPGYDTDASGYLSSSSKKSKTKKEKKGFFARLGRSKGDTDAEGGGEELGDEGGAAGYASEASVGKTKKDKKTKKTKEKDKAVAAAAAAIEPYPVPQPSSVPPLLSVTGAPRIAPLVLPSSSPSSSSGQTRSLAADAQGGQANDDWGPLLSLPPIAGRFATTLNSDPKPGEQSTSTSSQSPQPRHQLPDREAQERQLTSERSPVLASPKAVNASPTLTRQISSNSAGSSSPTAVMEIPISPLAIIKSKKKEKKDNVSVSSPSPVAYSPSSPSSSAADEKTNKINISLPISSSLADVHTRNDMVDEQKATSPTKGGRLRRPSLPPIFVGGVPTKVNDARDEDELQAPRGIGPDGNSQESSPIAPSSAYIVPSPGFQQVSSQTYLTAHTNIGSLSPSGQRPTSPGGTPWLQRSLSKKPSSQTLNSPSGAGGFQRPWQKEPPPSPPPTSPLPPPPALSPSPSPYPAPTTPLPPPPQASSMSLGPSISRAPSPLNFSSRPSPSSRPPPVTWKVPPQIQADAQPRLRGRPSLPDMRTSVAYTERNSVDDQDIQSGTLERSMSQIQRGRVSPFPSKPVGGVPRPAERRFGRVDSRMGRKDADNRHGPVAGMEKRVVFDFEVKVDEASDVDREEKRDVYGDEDDDEAGLAYDRSSYADGSYSARRSNHESINTTSTHTSTSTSNSLTSATSSSTKVTSSSSSASSHEYHQFTSMKYHDTPIHQGDGVEEDFDDDASVYTAGRKTMYFEDDLDEFGIDEVNVESALERLLISHGGQRKSLRPDSEFIDDDYADDEDTFDARKSIRMSRYEEEGRRGVVMDGALSGEVRERFIKRVREWKDVNEQESERRGGMSFEETQEVNKRLVGATMRGGVGYRNGVSPIPPVPALPGASTGMARGIGRGVGRGGRF